MKVKKFTHIAGVTFPNDDGESRQELLKQIYSGGDNNMPVLVSLKQTVFHNEQTGEDENAIQVFRNNKMLGWIPREDIEKCWEFNQMVCLVNHYKNIYSGALMVSEPPTCKQYGAMKQRKKKGLIKKMPEYDRLCYTFAISG